MDIIDELDRVQKCEADLERRASELDIEGRELAQMAGSGSINIGRLRAYDHNRRQLDQDWNQLLEEVAAILDTIEREDDDEA